MYGVFRDQCKVRPAEILYTLIATAASNLVFSWVFGSANSVTRSYPVMRKSCIHKEVNPLRSKILVDQSQVNNPQYLMNTQRGQSSNVLKPTILTPYILYFVSMTSNKLQCFQPTHFPSVQPPLWGFAINMACKKYCILVRYPWVNVSPGALLFIYYAGLRLERLKVDSLVFNLYFNCPCLLLCKY